MGGLVRRRDTIVPTNSTKIDLIPGLIVFAGRPLACVPHVVLLGTQKDYLTSEAAPQTGEV